MNMPGHVWKCISWSTILVRISYHRLCQLPSCLNLNKTHQDTSQCALHMLTIKTNAEVSLLDAVWATVLSELAMSCQDMSRCALAEQQELSWHASSIPAAVTSWGVSLYLFCLLTTILSQKLCLGVTNCLTLIELTEITLIFSFILS